MVDPEKYPGINVFVNLRNITNQQALERAGSVVTTYRLTELYNDLSIIGKIGVDINFNLYFRISTHGLDKFVLTQ